MVARSECAVVIDVAEGKTLGGEHVEFLYPKRRAGVAAVLINQRVAIVNSQRVGAGAERREVKGIRLLVTCVRDGLAHHRMTRRAVKVAQGSDGEDTIAVWLVENDIERMLVRWPEGD